MIGARVQLDLSPMAGLKGAGIRRALRIGMNRALSPVKASVVEHAAAIADTHALEKSIRIRLRTYPGDKYVGIIGPSTTFKRTRGKFTRGARAGQRRLHIPAKVAHLVEHGTRRSRARPWLRPAHAATAHEFLDRARVEVGREMLAELERRRG